MRSSSFVVAAAFVVGAPGIAAARDHQELVCSVVQDVKDGGDKIPLFVHFFEERGNDGASRDEILSTIYQGNLFQAIRNNKSGNPAKNAPIELKFGKTMRFRGSYTLESTAKGYALKLKGVVNDDPRGAKQELRDVNATLPCVDLSI